MSHRMRMRYEPYVRYAYNSLRFGFNPIIELIRRHPESLRYLCGLDVCADELGVPDWVIAPVVKALKNTASQSSLRQKSDTRFRTLATTVHVGEDFVHLLTGLRNIYDSICLYGLKSGDRLGHAIALGIEPISWAHSAGRICQPIEERIWDLLWIWEFVRSRRLELPNSDMLLVESQLVQCVRDWCNDPKLSTSNAIESIQQLRQEQTRFDDVLMLFERAMRMTIRSTRDLSLTSFLFSRELFLRGRRPIWIDLRAEKSMLLVVQSELRSIVAGLGITVEANPSSNLLIGNMSDLANHPLWRLRPPIPIDSVPRLKICVGSDDPITFVSNLRQEYQRLHDVLILAGVGESTATQWIDEVRDASMNARFTRPPTPT